MVEVLHDAVVQVTQVPSKFDSIGFPGADKQTTDFYPVGTRAIQLYDAAVENYFLTTFGRNQRRIVCECERSNEPSIAQALHLMNSEEISSKIRDRNGTARTLARSKKSPAEIIDELYQGTLSRFPNEAEKTVMLRVFADAGDDRAGAVEDVLWALLNSRSFVYNH